MHILHMDMLNETPMNMLNAALLIEREMYTVRTCSLLKHSA